MEIIYIDILFLINFIVNYFILLATARLCGHPFTRWRFALAAAAGGIYSVLALLPGLSPLTFAPMKIVLSGLMLLISFAPEKRLLRTALVFFAVSAAFGGAVYGASLLGKGNPAGGMTPVSPRLLVLSFGLCYGVISLVFRYAGAGDKGKIHQVELSFQGRQVCLRALRDTGNSLADPVSGMRVMVAQAGELKGLFSAELAEILNSSRDPVAALSKISQIPRCAGRFRLVPYTAVGVEMSLLLAFRPDSVSIDGQTRKNLLVALSPTRLCESGAYCALV